MDTTIVLDALPLTASPSIAARFNPPPGESVQSMLVRNSVRTLIRTLPVDQRASFIELNDKASQNYSDQVFMLPLAIRIS